jgi:flagellar biosynthesis protein FliP
MSRALRRTSAALAVFFAIVIAFHVVTTMQLAAPADAQIPPVPGIEEPTDGDGSTDTADQTIEIDVGGSEEGPSQSVLIILGLTVLALAPSLLIMLTSFTRIVIVLTLTRNALGLQGVPPNQVLTGLALFLSLFIMSPTLKELNEGALQPLLDGKMSYGEAYDAAQNPLRTFMLGQTRRGELNLFIKASGEPAPENREDVSMATLIPAFVLSELKTAFIIGFIVFVPFLIIDLVVSSALMSMGMFMLPPVLVSLPFKLLLFVMVDGWALVVKSLITSFN